MATNFDSDIPFIDSALVRYFLPDSDSFDSPLSELRARLNILATFALSMWAPPSAVLYFWLDAPILAGVMLVLCGFHVIPLLFIRRTGRYALVTYYVCFLTVGVLIWVAWTLGGTESSAIPWLIVPSAFAYVLAGKRAAQIWGGVGILAIFGISLADSYGFIPASEITAKFGNELMAYSVIALTGLLLQLFSIQSSVQEWTERNFNQAKERALEATRESFRTLIENSPDGILIHRDGTIQYANPAAADMLGLENGEALRGLDVGDFVLRDTPSAPGEPENTGEFRTSEMTVFDSDDRELPVEMTQFRAAYEGAPSMISVMRDLSKRRELRAQLMRMDRMAAVGTLAAGVGHEINNPLTFVLGNLHVLRAQLEAAGEDPSALDFGELAEAMDDAVEGAERIETIVSDLRTYSRVDDEPYYEPTCVVDSLESAVKMAKNEIRHRATLVRDLEDVPKVVADSSALGQVFLNLLINAAHAVDEGHADEDAITIRTRSNDGLVEVSVSDTGRGIEPEKCSRIFDPFYTTKSQDMGTGLGLAVCQNIVDEVGGEIVVDSTVGEGSTFTVRLPEIGKVEHAGDDAADVQHRPRIAP